MTTALSVMRPDIAKKLKFYISGTTTTAGATDGSNFICSSLKEYSDNALKNKWALIGGVKRKIDSNFQTNGTVRLLVPYAAQVATSTAFEIYGIDPDDIKAEINKAVKAVFPILCKITSDEATLDTIANTYEYAVPSTITGDPYQIWIEDSSSSYPFLKLLDWNYDIANVKVRFPYELPASRDLRLIGVTYLSTVTNDTDTIEVDEPQVQLIYAMVLSELCRVLAAGEIGTEGDKYQKQVTRWENEVEQLKDAHRMILPSRTLKIAGWRF